MRMTPSPPRPGGVAMATMVSEVENTGSSPSGYTLPDPGYFTEIMTVFSNASPMLSEVTDSISEIAKCTIRRS